MIWMSLAHLLFQVQQYLKFIKCWKKTLINGKLTLTSGALLSSSLSVGKKIFK